MPKQIEPRTNSRKDPNMEVQRMARDFSAESRKPVAGFAQGARRNRGINLADTGMSRDDAKVFKLLVILDAALLGNANDREVLLEEN